LDNDLLKFFRTGILGLGVLLTACAARPELIGVINIEQAYQRSPLAMASAIRLNAEFGETTNTIKARGRDLASLHRQLELGRDGMLPEVRASLETRIASETAALSALQAQYRVNLQAAQERESAAMVERITALASEFAQQHGLTLLIEHDAIVYANETSNSHRDITEAVIRELLERMNPTQVPAASRPDLSEH